MLWISTTDSHPRLFTKKSNKKPYLDETAAFELPTTMYSVGSTVASPAVTLADILRRTRPCTSASVSSDGSLPVTSPVSTNSSEIEHLRGCMEPPPMFSAAKVETGGDIPLVQPIPHVSITSPS